jgi:hypothetical protein
VTACRHVGGIAVAEYELLVRGPSGNRSELAVRLRPVVQISILWCLPLLLAVATTRVPFAVNAADTTPRGRPLLVTECIHDDALTDFSVSFQRVGGAEESSHPVHM